MRILIAPQEFKGSLTAIEAARAMAEGFRRALPQAELDLAPMADGGPGTVDALLLALPPRVDPPSAESVSRGSAARGRRLTARVQDPLGRPVEAAWALLEDGTAVIEMAAASGLVLLPAEERDPRRASTFGTGQLMAEALAAGAQHFIVGLGGSATNDGGAGMAQALGVRFLDGEGRDLPRPVGGADLSRLARIDASGLDPRLRECTVLAATDVINPLCGPEGASAVYGPQKGAAPEHVEELDRALAHYARIIERDLPPRAHPPRRTSAFGGDSLPAKGVAVADLPGAGAAGGLGAGLVAFLGAQLRPGAQLVAEAIGLAGRIARADLVVTGEGRLDAQTAYGKTVQVVARMAKASPLRAQAFGLEGLSPKARRDDGKPVLALVGSLAASTDELSAMGIDAAFSITEGEATEKDLAHAAEWLSALAERVGRRVTTHGIEGT